MRRVPVVLLAACLAVLASVAAPRVETPAGAAALGVNATLRGDLNGDGAADLAIAAPGQRVGGADGAGVVHVLYGSATGPTTAGSQLWSQNSRGIAQRAEPMDGFGAALATGDFNGDRWQDLAIGVPDENNSRGVVQVLYGSSAGLAARGAQLWSQNSRGIGDTSEARDRFGSGLAAGDFDRDGRADLAIGAPGENDRRGVIHVLPGSRTGLTATGSRRWSQDRRGVVDRAEPDDGFGVTLAAGDVNGDRRADLAAAVAGEDIGTIDGAGAVHVLYGSARGLTAARDQLWSQNSPGIGQHAEEGEALGIGLAIGDFDGDGHADLAAGAPGETLGVGRAAGVVNVLYGAPRGLTAARNQVWSQERRGVADLIEPRDLFGNTLAAGDVNDDGRSDLVVGAPGETIDDETSTAAFVAGVVHVLLGSSAGVTASGNELWSQDSRGVAEQAEDSDWFGEAVATGDYDGDGRADLAIGAAHERLAGRYAAGVVHVLPGSPTGVTATGSQLWSQATPGVAGAPERFDGFGQALAAGG